jgi:cytochrome c oxidase subunit 2
MRRSTAVAVLGLASALAACGGDKSADSAPVVNITAQQWQYTPSTISLKKGVTVELALTSKDVHHGFNLPEFNLRADIQPDQTTTLRLTPDKTGTFTFHCDYYCGSGHEEMQGQIVVQ